MKKTIYFLIIIFAFFLGVIGTLITMKDYFITEKVTKIEKTGIVGEGDSIATSVEIVYDAVVMIESYRNEKLLGTGTGFVYKKDDKKGYIITNHHVVENGTDIKVKFINGKTINGKVLGSDLYSDLAVVEVDEKAILKVALLGDSSKSQLGDILFTVGSPLGAEYMGTVTKGILSGKDRMVEVDSVKGQFLMNVIQTDAAINPGNSGGPLVNINGEVIGVNSLKLVKSEIEGMGFAIPIETAMKNINILEKGQEIKRPLLGVSIIDLTDQYALFSNKIYLEKDYENGVVLGSVDETKPAGVAGLQKGDVILEIDGVKVESMSQFRFLLFKYNLNDTIKVKYERNKEVKTVSIKLTESI